MGRRREGRGRARGSEWPQRRRRRVVAAFNGGTCSPARCLARQPRFIAKTIMRLLFLARTSVPSQQLNALPKLPMIIKVFELASQTRRCRLCLSLGTLWLSAG